MVQHVKLKLKQKKMATTRKKATPEVPQYPQTLDEIDNSVNKMFFVLVSLMFSLAIIIIVSVLVLNGIKANDENITKSKEEITATIKEQVNVVVSKQDATDSLIQTTLTPPIEDVNETNKALNRSIKSLDRTIKDKWK